jgi:hypothetical protein
MDREFFGPAPLEARNSLAYAQICLLVFSYSIHPSELGCKRASQESVCPLEGPFRAFEEENR